MLTTRRFLHPLVTEQGVHFRASIQHLAASGITASTFIEPRLVMFVLPNEPVKVGDVVTDRGGRKLLVGEHDLRDGKRVHKLFELTGQVSWFRPQKIVDLVTGLEKSGTLVDQGPLWCVMELYGRQEVDRALHNAIERSRLIVGAEVQLNDQIDERMVRRIYTVYGLNVIEIQ